MQKCVLDKNKKSGEEYEKNKFIFLNYSVKNYQLIMLGQNSSKVEAYAPAVLSFDFARQCQRAKVETSSFFTDEARHILKLLFVKGVTLQQLQLMSSEDILRELEHEELLHSFSDFPFTLNRITAVVFDNLHKQ